MRKIEFTTTLYIEDFTTDEDLVWQALRYGSKHQDFYFGDVEILSVEDYEEEDE